MKKETVDVELVESTTEELQYKDIHELIDLNKKYNDSLEEIQNESENILESFFTIGKEFSYIQENKLYLIDGYKNIYELAEDKFNFKKTTCHNMIAVFNKYKNENKKLDEKYSGYSFSNLVELLPVPKEEIIEENFHPGMTVKEIRNSKFKLQLSEHFKNMVRRIEEVEKLFKDKVDEYNDEEPNKKLHIKINKEYYNLSEDNFNVKINYSIFSGYSYYFCSLYYNSFSIKILFDGHDILEYDNSRLIDLFVYNMEKYRNYAIDKLSEDDKLKKEKQKEENDKNNRKKLKYDITSFSSLSYTKPDVYYIFNFILFLLNGLIDDYFSNYSPIEDLRKYEENYAYVLYLRKNKKEICKLIIATGCAGDYLAFDYSKEDYESSDKLLLNGKSHRALLKDKDSLLDLIKDQCSYINLLLENGGDNDDR